MVLIWGRCQPATNQNNPPNVTIIPKNKAKLVLKMVLNMFVIGEGVFFVPSIKCVKKNPIVHSNGTEFTLSVNITLHMDTCLVTYFKNKIFPSGIYQILKSHSIFY